MQYFPLNNATQVLNGLPPYYGAAEDCPICLDTFEDKEVVGHYDVRVVNGQRKVLDSFTHAAHKMCIEGVIEYSKETGKNRSCPICKIDISHDWFNNGINATAPKAPPLILQDNYEPDFLLFQIHQHFIPAPPPLSLMGRIHVILGRIFDEVGECAAAGAIGCCGGRVAFVVAKAAITVLSGGLAPTAGVFFTAVLINGVDGLVLGAACGGIGAIVGNIFDHSDSNFRYFGAAYTSICAVVFREMGLGLTHSIIGASAYFTTICVIVTVASLIFKR